MVETKPIMVTEIDWSPEDPDKASEGHYNEWGQWIQPNLGSWATASTSNGDWHGRQFTTTLAISE